MTSHSDKLSPLVKEIDMKDFIRIEQVAFASSPKATRLRYFVDLVSLDTDGGQSTGGLFNSWMREKAVRYARDEATRLGLTVDNRLPA